MISIDQLRRLDGKPHYMGLGVIKLPFRKNRAYHFYSDYSPAIVDDIHDHRFGFTSVVVRGSVTNHIYLVGDEYDPESTLQVERGECSRGAKRTIEQSNVALIKACKFTTTVGLSYRIAHHTLHRIETTSPTITLLAKELPFKQTTPRFVVDTANPSPCAFSQPKSESECWEIIELVLTTGIEPVASSLPRMRSTN